MGFPPFPASLFSHIFEQSITDLERLRESLERSAQNVGQCVSPAPSSIAVVVANERTVLVIDFEWILLFHVQAQFPEPMGQRVLIDLFQVAVLGVAVNREPHRTAS